MSGSTPARHGGYTPRLPVEWSRQHHMLGLPAQYPRIRTVSLRTKVSVAGKRNFQGRDKEAETAWKVQGPRCRDKASLNNPANSGLVSENQEISVSGRMRGGPGRTRTSNQAVMSAVTAPKRSAIIGIFARVRRRLFLFGYGVSLVIRWLSIVKKHQRFV